MNLHHLGIDSTVRALIRHAALRTPGPLAERLEEEWLADLAARSGPISRLRFALGCCWAATVIAHGQFVPKAAVAGAGLKGAVAFVTPDSSRFSRRTAAILAIAGVHALVIYAFTTGLAHKVISVISPPLDVVPMPDTRQPVKAPSLGPPQLTNPRFEELELRHEFDFRTDPQPLPPALIGDPVIFTPPPEGPPVLIDRVPGGPGKGFPNTEEFYPPVSKRMGEAGISTIQVCVNSRGVLTAEPIVTQSSGSPRLDEGAVKLAKAGSGHYRATTENHQPVDSCYAFRVKFALRN